MSVKERILRPIMRIPKGIIPFGEVRRQRLWTPTDCKQSAPQSAKRPCFLTTNQEGVSPRVVPNINKERQENGINHISCLFFFQSGTGLLMIGCGMRPFMLPSFGIASASCPFHSEIAAENNCPPDTRIAVRSTIQMPNSSTANTSHSISSPVYNPDEN